MGRPAGRDGGRPAGRSAGRTPGRSSGRTVVGGVRVVSSAEKKKHLIEVAPFGRLDQMLRTTERGPKKKHLIKAAPSGRLDQMLRTALQRGRLGGLCPPSQKLVGLGHSAPQPKPKTFRKIF